MITTRRSFLKILTGGIVATSVPIVGLSKPVEIKFKLDNIEVIDNPIRLDSIVRGTAEAINLRSKDPVMCYWSVEFNDYFMRNPKLMYEKISEHIEQYFKTEKHIKGEVIRPRGAIKYWKKKRERT